MWCLVHGWCHGQGHGGCGEYRGQGYGGCSLGSILWVVYLVNLPTEPALVQFQGEFFSISMEPFHMG